MDRILCVDDEPNILAAYQRLLRKTAEIDIATGGEAGLTAIKTAQAERKPYAVVMADMHMPGMDGATFLGKVAQAAPETVRIMVTGAQDLGTAISAINDGGIFRFLTKPVPGEMLAKALHDAFAQYRLVTAERELLENTLNGSVRTLIDILSLLDAEGFGRAEALRDGARRLCARLGENPWRVELAAMLSPIGRVALPPPVIIKASHGSKLDAAEAEMIARVPEVGANLLRHIPRLDEVSRIILYQDKRYDGGGFPLDAAKGEAIPLGARILHLLLRLQKLEKSGMSRPLAIGRAAEDQGDIDPRVLAAASAEWAGGVRPLQLVEVIKEVKWRELVVGQTLRTAIKTSNGIILANPGAVVSPTMLERLANFARMGGIEEPITIVEPLPTA